MSNATNILLRHNFIAIPKGTANSTNEQAVATILMNLSYYGKALSVESYKALVKLSTPEMISWWGDVEAQLKSITGEDRKIGDFVVYKNFPAEVLEKDLASYWIPQILMYWGFPNEMFTEEVKPREKMSEQPKCLVLKLSKDSTLGDILGSYLKAPARWKDHELADVLFLADWYPINLTSIAFKENLVTLAASMMKQGKTIKIGTATDVLRLAAGLSDGDVSLRDKTKFRSFKKAERRFLLNILEGCSNLEEDVARRPELWKRLFHHLHPGDYKRSYPNVIHVMNGMYNDELETFNSKVESMLLSKNSKVLKLLSQRPGEFRRRLVHTLNLFGLKAVKAFVADEVLSKLTTAQIVSTRSFLGTVNERSGRIFPPKGNWGRAQLGEARPVKDNHAKAISKALGKVLHERVPSVKVLDPATSMIKLPNNGEEGPYTRGTVFPIPEDVKFIRTASYWKINSRGYVWFDNGWNFFTQDWKPVGACCWSAPFFPARGWSQKSKDDNTGSVFSGDPTNTKDMQGRAAQLIDLYPDQLRKQGVRYAVWSILCYSRITFSQAEDVFAALQWGKDPQKGKLFEPSRCQVTLPLKGDQLTKMIVLIDLDKMEMVYLDAGLKGNVSSAAGNGAILEKIMPSFMEHIKSLPSVHDLFQESVDADAETQILYSDKDAELKGEPAYVFRPENKASKYKSVDINTILT